MMNLGSKERLNSGWRRIKGSVHRLMGAVLRFLEWTKWPRFQKSEYDCLEVYGGRILRIRKDPETRRLFNQYVAEVRKALLEPGQREEPSEK